MIQIDFDQIQADFPHYLEQVARGESFVVTRNNEPIAELRPVTRPPKTRRPLGLGQGLGEILPSFFEPLPDDVLNSFGGEES